MISSIVIVKKDKERIKKIRIKLKDDIYDFVKKFDIDLIIPENALTIPMNIPLGIAITEFIAETNIQTIAHHHDFYWERDRFMINAIQDYLNMFGKNLDVILNLQDLFGFVYHFYLCPLLD